MGLLHELVPQAETIGFIWNPRFASAIENQVRDAEEAARALALKLRKLPATTVGEIDAAFDTIREERILALAVSADPFFDTRRDKLIALAARHAVPTMYHFREYAEAGGLMSYGVVSTDVFRQVGTYVARILMGAKPADLPVQRPTKFELVINLKTARALGITIPRSLLALADEVIE